MKPLRHALAVAALLVGPAAAAGDLSLGLGLGGSYSVMGFNVALRGNDDLKYVSLGCTTVAYYSSDGAHAACGPGAGWWKAGLLGEGTRHALGAYLGPVSTHTAGYREMKPVYGLGLGYNYYFRGISQPGFNAGLMPTLSRSEGATKAGMLVGLGYQF